MGCEAECMCNEFSGDRQLGASVFEAPNPKLVVK